MPWLQLLPLLLRFALHMHARLQPILHKTNSRIGLTAQNVSQAPLDQQV